MRLINTRSLQLKEFLSDVPPYAILSHTWAADADEVTFQEFRKRKRATRAKSGYKKIQQAAEQATKDGHEWLWADTCCIDKRSSAELSEAINSMFKYYARSEICYALLSDVTIGEDLHSPNSAFRRSRWFTRGWTLQELIAPCEVIFFCSSWFQLGDKSELADLITDITGIGKDALNGHELEEFSVAKRMSWASGRTTKRLEDEAYCLFGLFNVSLPPLYGEGQKAFLRLQEEIVKWTDDHSIFAWTEGCQKARGWEILAPSPSHFLGAQNILAETFDHMDDESEDDGSDKEEHEALPFSLTNAGLEIQLPLLTVDKESGRYDAALECTMDKMPCDCGQVVGSSEERHETHCRSLLANNRVILELLKIKGTAHACSRLSIRYGPVTDGFESRRIYLW